MDTKLKKSKAVIGFISLLMGGVILGVNLLVLFAEVSHQENFLERAACVFEEDYQNTEEFRRSMSNYLDIFLSMSIADESGEETDGEKEAARAGRGEREPDGGYSEAERELGIYDDASDTVAADYPEWAASGEMITEWADDDYYDEEDYENYYENYYNKFGYYEDYYNELGYYEDYYDYDYNYEYGSYMDKTDAERYHKALKGNRNVLYRVEKSGEVLYTNEENMGAGLNAAEAGEYRYEIDGRSFVMPEGYNFLLYFDGEKVRIWKNRFEINVYGDGFYREESQWYVPGYRNFEVDKAIKDTRVYIAVAQTPGIFIRNRFEKDADNFYYNNNLFYNMRNSIKSEKNAYLRWIYSMVLAIVLFLVGYICRKERRELNEAIGKFTGKLWYEIKLIPLLAVLCGLWICFMIFINDLHWMGEAYFYDLWDGYVYVPKRYVLIYVGWFVAIFILWMFMNDCRYNKKAWKNSLTGKVIGLFGTSMLKLPASRRMVRRGIGICLFVWTMCIAGIFFVIILEEGILTSGLDLLVGALLLAVVIGCPLLFVKSSKKMAEDVDNLVEQIQSIHDGELREGNAMWEGSGLSGAMENLNDIRNGMNKAVLERTKSERMKVELVANVSYDIKTPLTSIISYVELLKQEEGLPEHVKEYILILENKSMRLKSMVQDVFEVSKAASGNLPVNLEELDLGKLLRQTIADMGEQIENSQVKLKTEMPENAVMIYADGERIYRVFQNLIQNALRYSLEGSRVHITLREDGKTAIASVKNTSREELPPNMDFTERFTRGDESRSDGGSGLGLSIARSFTEACGGSFKVETIADLFVVTVTFPGREAYGEERRAIEI